MSVIDSIASRAMASGRTVIRANGGIGIEFSDGCDVCWLLPGEPKSTLPIVGSEQSAEELWTEFERIDHVRSRALHVIRHYLASKGVEVDRRRCGTWGIQTESGCSSSIMVGAYLTQLAREGKTVYELVQSRFGRYGLVRHAPTKTRIDRYLALQGAPANEQSVTDRPPIQIFKRQTIASVLAMMGLCRALETDATIDSADALIAAARPDGPVAQALLRMGERLGDVEAGIDILGSQALTIQFDDRLDSYGVSPKSRELAQRIRASGPLEAGDALADEFMTLNKARAQVIGAVVRAAAKRGWALDKCNVPFASTGASWHLGNSLREVTFEPGSPLTGAIKSHAPALAIQNLLGSNPAFASDCIAELADATLAHPRLPERRLAPLPPAHQPALPELNAETIAELDASADGTIREFLKSDEALRAYLDPNQFDPKIDTWVTLSDWVAVAERSLRGEWVNTAAVLILLDAGDARAREHANRYFMTCTPHHEVASTEIELVWRLRHERPDIAKDWFSPQEHDDVPYADVRARLGDPIALRHVNIDRQADLSEFEDLIVETTSRDITFNASQIDQLHDKLLNWARSASMWSPPLERPLTLAHQFGFPDVADALDDNPYLSHGLLIGDRRHEMMDEPGLLMGSGLVLAWSRLRPTRLLARLIISAWNGERLVAEAERVARESVERNPRARAGLDISLSAYRAWLSALRPALAIAWKRWRHSPAAGAFA
jgi:hypothetical protein